jgi:hypothetical protein
MVGHRASQVAWRVDGKMRKLTGFEYLHVIVDDYGRLAYAEVLSDLTADRAIPSSAAPSPAASRSARS